MEVEAAVSAYREMLIFQLSGEAYNKRQRNLALQQIIGRSSGSIERKHQNISAVLNQDGFYSIPGYKPLGNFQTLLEEVVTERIIGDPLLQTLATEASVRAQFAPAIPEDILSILVPSPDLSASKGSSYGLLNEDEPRRISSPLPADNPVLPRRDYLALEARNSALGSGGEDLAMQYEHKRLWTAGARHLADRIEHVSVTHGDSLGYDILSFETNGRERLIEVKTTQSGPLAPFYLSANEVRISTEHSQQYHLYRIYDFLSKKNPKLFQLQGALGQTCLLNPTLYRGTIRP